MTTPIAASDETLIRRCKQGDPDAFASLYDRYLPRVFNRVRYMVPEPDVEDVTQEVFLALLKSLHTFRGDSLFTTWLRTLINHKVAEYYRRRYRRRDNLRADLSQAESRADHSNPRNMEERIALQRSLLRLPKSYREVILLRFAEGLPFDEIARLLRQNPEATKSLFRRAIAALRNSLNDDENTP